MDTLRNNGCVSLSPPGSACSHYPWHCLVAGRQRAPGLPHEPEWEAGVFAKTEHTRGHVGAFWREQSGSKIQDEKRERCFNPYPRKQQLHYCKGEIYKCTVTSFGQTACRVLVWIASPTASPLVFYNPFEFRLMLGTIPVSSYPNYFPGIGQTNKVWMVWFLNTFFLV